MEGKELDFEWACQSTLRCFKLKQSCASKSTYQLFGRKLGQIASLLKLKFDRCTFVEARDSSAASSAAKSIGKSLTSFFSASKQEVEEESKEEAVPNSINWLLALRESGSVRYLTLKGYKGVGEKASYTSQMVLGLVKVLTPRIGANLVRLDLLEL